MVWCGNSVCR